MLKSLPKYTQYILQMLSMDWTEIKLFSTRPCSSTLGQMTSILYFGAMLFGGEALIEMLVHISPRTTLGALKSLEIKLLSCHFFVMLPTLCQNPFILLCAISYTVVIRVFICAQL